MSRLLLKNKIYNYNIEMQNIKNIIENNKNTINVKKSQLKKYSAKQLRDTIKNYNLINRSSFTRKEDMINFLLTYSDLFNSKRNELIKQTNTKGRWKMTKQTLINTIVKEKKYTPISIPFKIKTGITTVPPPPPIVKPIVPTLSLQSLLNQRLATKLPIPDDDFDKTNLNNIIIKFEEINKLPNNADKLEQLLNLIREFGFIKYNKLTNEAKKQIKPLLNNIKQVLLNISSTFKDNNKYVKVKMIRTDDSIVFYTFNPKTINEIIERLRSGFTFVDVTPEFSDVVVDFFKEFVKEIEVEIFEFKFKTDKSGKFFDKINISPFDLSRYQIIKNKKEIKLLDDHCFIYAMKMSGQFEENIINSVKLCIKNNYLRKYDIEKVCGIINRQVEVYHFNTEQKKIDKNIYGKEYEKVFKVGLINAHYFIFEDVKITRFASRNWKEIIETGKAHAINKINKIKKIVKGTFKYEKDKFNLNSLSLINELTKSGAFETSGIFAEVHDILNDYNEKNYIPYLDDVENDCLLIADEKYDYTKKIKEQYTDIIFADCESTTKGDKHKVMAIGCENLRKTLKINFVSTAERDRERDLFEQFFDYIMYKNKNNNKIITKKFKNGKTKEVKAQQKFLIYFHNLKYDKSFFKTKFAVTDTCEKDGILYEFKIYYQGCQFIFRDSYKIIPAPIAKFGEMFDINVEKDVLPYDLYTDETIYTEKQKVEDALKYLKPSDHKQFIENLEKLDLYFDNEKAYFYHMEYMEYYLTKDVEVLKQGMLKQREVFMELTGLSVFDYLTIPSITYHYLIKEHVFDDIYEIGGQTRCFIQKNVRGGRVATKQNKKWFIDGAIHGNIVDFDACSLYPSAIYRICKELGGFPTGTCKIIKNEDLNIEKLNKYNYYVVEIKINKINKHLPISFISDVVDDKTIFSNEVPKNNLVVDSITLEDWIKFHEIEYEIIKGVYWNNGVNGKFGEKIEFLYNQRKIYKKQKNTAMSNCLKLIMNSSYGKTIMKPSISTKINKFNITEKHKEEIKKFIVQNYNRIGPSKEYEQYVEFEVRKSFIDHYNSCHIGGLILSMSKRIMNEVMALAFDNGVEIFYQDTDSMHMFQKDVERLGELYQEKYNKKLIGGDLGQFHSDFEMKGAEDEVVSTKCIILGKKAYLDVLEAHDKEGNVITDYHIRMKGVNKAGLEDAKNNVGSYEKLYKKLYDDEEINFNLCADKFRPKFSYTKTGEVFTESKFERAVKFNYPKGNLN